MSEQTDRVREFVKEMSQDVPGSAPYPSDNDFAAYFKGIDTAERQLRRAAYNLHLQGIYLNGAASGSYLYVISGLHLLHVMAGLFFIMVVLSPASRAAIDPVSALVYSTDKYRVLQLRLLATYWHFLGGVWLAMFLVFWLLLG